MQAPVTDPPKNGGSESPTHLAGISGYAVFDFDRTIVAIDTGSTFLRGLYRRSPLRLPLAIAVTPRSPSIHPPVGAVIVRLDRDRWTDGGGPKGSL